MLRLPSLLQQGESGDGVVHPLRLCFHLNGETETQVDDFDTIRRRKASKIKEAARRRGEEDTTDFHWLPQVKKNPRARVKKALGDGQISCGTGHIIKLPPEYCETGGDEVPASPTRQNISHTGSWLDSRAFASINDVYYAAGDRKTSGVSIAKGLSDGDRLFVKRCKENLKKRFGHNIQLAMRKLDMDHSESISQNEFVRATTTLFKAYEARLLYRLLDTNNDESVTLRELHTLLDRN